MKRPREPLFSTKCPVCGGENSFLIKLTYIMDLVPDCILEGNLLMADEEVMVSGPITSNRSVVVRPEDRMVSCALKGKIALGDAVDRVVYCGYCLYKPPCRYEDKELLVVERRLPWLVRKIHNARRWFRDIGRGMTTSDTGSQW